MQIEGTTDNEIYKLGTLSAWTYEAIIADSVKLNKAKRISDEWKEKLANMFGERLTVARYKVLGVVRYGWSFSNKTGQIISITVMPLRDGKLNRIYLNM